MEQIISLKYPLILRQVNSGDSLNAAIKSAGVGRTSFYKWRYMVEMQIVDPQHYNQLRTEFRCSALLSYHCKYLLTDAKSSFFNIAEQKRRDKQLLS